MGIYQICPGIKYSIDDKIASILEKKRNLVNKKDRDYFFIVDGEEGCGKSWLAFQLAKFLDPSFNLSRVALNGRDLLKIIADARKGQAIVFDEAFAGLSSRAAMSEINRVLVETFMEVRKKNLFVFIVLPSIFYLDKYVVLNRGRVLFHCYFYKERRGFYKVYNRQQIKTLILKGKQTMSYGVIKARLRGSFSSKFALDVEGSDENELKYSEMKINAINNKGKSKLSIKQTLQRDALIYYLKVKLNYTQKQIYEIYKSLDIDMSFEAIKTSLRSISDRLGLHAYKTRV